MQNLLERELKERSRQSGLMRQYFFEKFQSKNFPKIFLQKAQTAKIRDSSLILYGNYLFF